MKPNGRIYQIDLFRFFAALCVVLYHYFFRGYEADNKHNLNFNELGECFKYGYLGVDFFFIISGFVIALSIKHNSLLKFIISRITRLYPIYWICVLLSFITIITFGYPRFSFELKEFIVNLTMFQNYVGVKSVDTVYWSLFVEMKFYIFVVGIYLLIKKRISKVKLDHLIYSWSLLTVLYVFFNDMYIFKVANFFLILNWSSYFIAGIVFYQIYAKRITLNYCALLFLSFGVSLNHAISRIEYLELKFDNSFSPFIISFLITVFYILMILVTNKKLSVINSPRLMKLGMLTYPLYLLHQNIGYIIFNNLGPLINQFVLVIGTLFFMLIISYLLSEFYEPKVSNYLKIKLKRFAAGATKPTNYLQDYN